MEHLQEAECTSNNDHHLMDTTSVISSLSRRRQARLSRRRQGTAWASWPEDPVDFWGIKSRQDAASAEKRLDMPCSGQSHGKSRGRHADKSVPARRGHDQLPRSWSVKDQSGNEALKASKSSMGGSESGPQLRSWQEDQDARGKRGDKDIAAAARSQSLCGPAAAELLRQKVLWGLLVWGNAVAACALLCLHWGAYAGGHTKHPFSSLAGASAVLAGEGTICNCPGRANQMADLSPSTHYSVLYGPPLT